jgi:hypothetical protein
MSITKPSAVVAGKAIGENAYNVLLSVGSSAVAVDVHEAGFVAGEEAAVVQVGDKYGIMKLSTTLPGVLQVPDASLQAIAEENIAAFAAAYIGYQLGRMARLYASALVTAVTAGYVAMTFSEGTLSGQAGRLDTAPGSGLVPRDFLVGDSVVIALRPAVGVAGWWHRGDYPDVPCIVGAAEVGILLCDEHGEWIEEADSDYWPVATVEWGDYDEISATEWEYHAYSLSEDLPSAPIMEDLSGPLAVVLTGGSFARLPNSFRVSFTYRGTAYTATLSADKLLQPRGDLSAIIGANGSVSAAVVTSLPEGDATAEAISQAESPLPTTTLLDDFVGFGETLFWAPAGFADVSPEDAVEFSHVVTGEASIDIKTGYASGNGPFTMQPESGVTISGNWRLRAFLQYRRPYDTKNAQCTGHATATATSEGGTASVTVTGAGAADLYFQGVLIPRPYKSEIVP